MIKFFNSLLLSVVCLAAGQLSLMERYVVCIAGDGCVSVSGHGHSHHCCEEEKAPVCACEHHAPVVESSTENFVSSDCTDIEIEFSTLLQTVNDAFALPQFYVESPRFEIPEFASVYKAPIWCRHLVYPPPILDHIRSTIILC